MSDNESVTHGYNLRNRSNVNYQSMHQYGKAQLIHLQDKWVAKQAVSKDGKPKVNIKIDDLYRRTVGTVLTQMSKVDKYAQVSVTEGIKRHGDKAIAAVLSEFSQLNDKGVFKPRKPCELSKNDKREALNLVTMAKEKRDGKIKVCVSADGQKQRRYI